MRVAAIDLAGRSLDLSRPRVMGILNATPDSFSDGGECLLPDQALARARQMVAEGADIIDVGGESTRPGASPVSPQQELQRVVPIIRGICGELSVPVSVDTSKPEVMRAAVKAGACLINDVMALRMPDALRTAAELGVPVCLMHMQGEPRTMQHSPQYGDVLRDVRLFLEERANACRVAGIASDRVLIDPGFGFGKRLNHNLLLLKNLQIFADMGMPLLVGISRKSMIGTILGDAPADRRLFGSVAAAVLAAERGASIIRVHDVGPTVEALRVVSAVQAAQWERG